MPRGSPSRPEHELAWPTADGLALRYLGHSMAQTGARHLRIACVLVRFDLQGDGLLVDLYPPGSGLRLSAGLFRQGHHIQLTATPDAVIETGAGCLALSDLIALEATSD